MAEMTAMEAVKVLMLAKDAPGKIPDGLAQLVIALIEQQAQEIAKKDRMLERATWVLDRTGSCPKTCDLMRNLCAARACWLAWLEKEETKEAEAQ